MAGSDSVSYTAQQAEQLENHRRVWQGEGMTYDLPSLPSSLARSARALVGTSAADTAAAAGLTRRQLRDHEKGLFPLTATEQRALRIALEGLGAHFVSDGIDGRGHGVRLKFSAIKTERVESWEAEGGLAADDDV